MCMAQVVKEAILKMVMQMIILHGATDHKVMSVVSSILFVW